MLEIGRRPGWLPACSAVAEMIYVFYPFNDGTAVATLNDLAPAFGQVPPVQEQGVAPAFGRIYREGHFLDTLAMAGANDEIWIVGHCAKAMKVMGDSNHNTIDQTEIVNRLVNCGMQPNCSARIVLYACESAKGETASLAAMVATALANRQLPCAQNVWGFTHKMGMKAKDGMLRIEYGDWMDYYPEMREFTLIHRAPNRY